MAEATDQEGFKAEKYQKIIALLSTHQQGREFLDQFVDGMGRLNDNHLSNERMDQGLTLLDQAMGQLEQLVHNQEEARLKIGQIIQSLGGTADQLRASEEHGIAVRVLEDVQQQLVSLDERQESRIKRSEGALEQLEKAEQYFAEINEDCRSNKKNEEDQNVSLRAKKKTSFF